MAVIPLFDKKIWNVGDLVVLKSGGPALTVRNFVPGTGKNQGTVTVDWFMEAENLQGTFYENQLIHFSVEYAPDEEEQSD